MADFTQRDVHLVRHEYALESPTNYADLAKAVAHALQQMPERLRTHEDTLKVEARDDEIVLTWQENQR